MFGHYIIPFQSIVKVEISESDVKRALHGGSRASVFSMAAKLDLANLNRHIVLEKSEGVFNRILFTPDNIDEFMNILNKAISDFKLRS